MNHWLRWFRIRLIGTAFSNALVGYWIAGGATVSSSDAVTQILPLLGATACFYLFGMGLNDYCDRTRDAELYPDRPLPSGAISVGTAKLALGVLIVSAALIVALTPIATLATYKAAAALVACIVGYNAFLKDHKLLGPVAMGSVRGALVVFGATVADPGIFSAPDWVKSCLVPAGAVLGYVALVTSYSLLEESGEPDSQRRRYKFVTLWIVVCCIAALRSQNSIDGFKAASWLLPLLWSVFYAGIPLYRGAPGGTTFRMLIGLFLLDAAILVSYDHTRWATIPLLLWLVVAGPMWFRSLPWFQAIRPNSKR